MRDSQAKAGYHAEIRLGPSSWDQGTHISTVTDSSKIQDPALYQDPSGCQHRRLRVEARTRTGNHSGYSSARRPRNQHGFGWIGCLSMQHMLTFQVFLMRLGPPQLTQDWAGTRSLASQLGRRCLSGGAQGGSAGLDPERAMLAVRSGGD